MGRIDDIIYDDTTCGDLNRSSLAGMDDKTCDDLIYNDLIYDDLDPES